MVLEMENKTPGSAANSDRGILHTIFSIEKA